MEDYLGTYKNRPRTVVFYGRVSTEHEQQISALGNQMEWYANLAERNPNWTVVAQYIDEGITGTQMKKRPSFMQMMDCLLYTSPSPRDRPRSRMPSSA